MMKNAILAYLSAAISMVTVDAVWLSITASRLYKAELGDMLLPAFKVAPAALFYFLYVFGIVALVVLPAVAERRLGVALIRGAVLGMVAYATYDLTNQATLKGWSQMVTIADICWGTFLTALAATIATWVTLRFGHRIG